MPKSNPAFYSPEAQFAIANEAKNEVSAFNSAFLEMQRLHQLWQDCNLYASAGKLEQWRWKLDRVWIEMSGKAARKNKKHYFDINNQYNEAIKNAKHDKQELYDALQNKEIFLRTLADELGLGIKWKDLDESMEM